MTEVTQPVLIKAGDLFLVARNDGNVPRGNLDGFGLFCRDCRCLARYELTLGAATPMVLMSSSARGDTAVLELANNRYAVGDQGCVERQSVGVRWERRIEPAAPALQERLSLRNFTREPVRVPLTLRFGTRFEDIFELRGAAPGVRGVLRPPTLDGDRVGFRYDGADAVRRELAVRFSRPARLQPDGEDGVVAAFDFDLAPQEQVELTVVFEPSETPDDGQRHRPTIPDAYALFDSDDRRLNAVVSRSLSDLRMLRSGDDPAFVAGGAPWFIALFGRDSLIAALQTLAFDSDAAAGTLRRLAAHRGRKVDPRTGEEPGKIPHELRVGEMARMGEVPYSPGYQSIDSTPLFLIVLGLHARWTGDLALFNELRGAVEAALDWLAGRMGAHGWLDYEGLAEDGIANQGWKDSGGAVLRADGTLPEPPIALVEVQAYVFKAWRLMAELYVHAGEAERAATLEAAAEDLRTRLERDFWIEAEGCYALALERGGRRVEAIASNAGQVLWAGVAAPDRAARTAERLMREDMFCGWGVRTLSERAPAYNPVHYHLGSVWPFDNSLIVAGLSDYGLTQAAGRILEGLLSAAECFSMGRLPEFFVGVQREPGLFPGRCPFADPLQAWSAGAVPYMLTATLGLRPDGFARKLRIVRPALPAGVDRLRVKAMVGDGTVDCRFERGARGVRVHAEGDVTVEVVD